MLTITTNSFENDVLRADKPVLVDFWAQWCPYCRRIAPAFEKVGEQFADTTATRANTRRKLRNGKVARICFIIYIDII